MKTLLIKAFSLTELLVALSIVAIVVAIIMPRFFTVQASAKDVVAVQMAGQLNHTLAEWTAAGGTVTGAPVTSDLLAVLTDTTGNLVVANAAMGSVIKDGGTSNSVRLSVPESLQVAVNLAQAAGGASVVMSPDIGILYNPGTGQFVAASADRLTTPGNRAALFGDMNGNGVIDDTDLAFFVMSFGSAPQTIGNLVSTIWSSLNGVPMGTLNHYLIYIPACDYDNDGKIDNEDMVHFDVSRRQGQ